MVYIIYVDRAGYWRWQLVSANHKVIADSGEGYVNKADCLHGITLVKGSNTTPVRER